MENTGVLKKRFRKSKICLIAISAMYMLLLTISFFSDQQWALFHAKEIKGSVVEADTQTPLEGAIVVGMWQLSQILSEGFGGYAKVIETRTDKNGKFVIPCWITFKPWKLYTLTHGNAPTLLIYKPGYKLHFSARASIKPSRGSLDIVDMRAEMTDEALKKAIDSYSINPARLIRVTTDEERIQNYRDWGTKARFPGKQFSREQSEEIFDALEEDISQLSKDSKDRKILLGISNLRKFWGIK